MSRKRPRGQPEPCAGRPDDVLTRLRAQIAEGNEERQSLQEELTELKAQMTLLQNANQQQQHHNARLGRKLAQAEERQRCQNGEKTALARCTDQQLVKLRSETWHLLPAIMETQFERVMAKETAVFEQKKGLESTECSICSDTFKNAVITDCAHTFCESCLGKWRETNTTCPICRADIGDPWKTKKPNHAMRDATKRLVEMHQDLFSLSTALAVGNVHRSLQTNYERLNTRVRAFLP